MNTNDAGVYQVSTYFFQSYNNLAKACPEAKPKDLSLRKVLYFTTPPIP